MLRFRRPETLSGSPGACLGADESCAFLTPATAPALDQASLLQLHRSALAGWGWCHLSSDPDVVLLADSSDRVPRLAEGLCVRHRHHSSSAPWLQPGFALLPHGFALLAQPLNSWNSGDPALMPAHNPEGLARIAPSQRALCHQGRARLRGADPCRSEVWLLALPGVEFLLLESPFEWREAGLGRCFAGHLPGQTRGPGEALPDISLA